MTCRECGTEIAEKALICFRCGASVTEPVHKPYALKPKRKRSVLVYVLLAVLVAIALLLAILGSGLLTLGARL
jgi:hypothetical protein